MPKRSGPPLSRSSMTKVSKLTPVATVSAKKSKTEEIEVKYYDTSLSATPATSWAIGILISPVLGDGPNQRKGRVIKYADGEVRALGYAGVALAGKHCIFRTVLIEYNQMINPIASTFFTNPSDINSAFNQDQAGNFKVLFDHTKSMNSGYGLLSGPTPLVDSVKPFKFKFKRGSVVNFNGVAPSKGLAWLVCFTQNELNAGLSGDFRQYFTDV